MSPIYDSRKQVELYIIGILLMFAVFYGGFRAYPLLAGPNITIYSPQNDDIVASSTFQISGRVLRSKEITLQGRTITIDNEGYFTETLVPQFPYTTVILSATDSYGASITKTLRVIPK
ncbi:MAG: hypothetical protein WCT07_02965 [Candidatus Paceibacterota bacterium]|jgi:hypothetical protein